MTLLRHAKKSWVSGGVISDEAFQLRTNPPENYISLVYSNEISNAEKMQDAALALKQMRRTVRNNDPFLFLELQQALQRVNLNREIIAIEKKDHHPQKYGLRYVSQDPMEINHAKTVLTFLSMFDFYQEAITN